jgi:hypothetical protein
VNRELLTKGAEALILKAQEVQSLRFNKKKFTTAQAKKWAKDHGFKSGNVEETPNQIRLRQFDPDRCTGAPKTLTRNFPAGISAFSCSVGK